MTKAQQAERDDAIQRLRGFLKPGDTVFCTLRKVSSSGMTRSIDFHKIECDSNGQPVVFWLSGLMSKALGMRLNKDDGLRVSSCGMDMGFHVVYNLGATLWPEGTPEPHGTRNGEPDSDGGYALKSRWL